MNKKFKVVLPALVLVTSLTTYGVNVENGVINLLENKVLAATMADVQHPILTIGADETERNFTWYSSTSENGHLAIVKAGENFSNARIFDASIITNTNLGTMNSFQVRVTGLEPNTEYTYKVFHGNSLETATSISTEYSFKTMGNNNYSFFAVGDPQIGSGGTLNGTEGWQDTIDKLKGIDSTASFMLSAGDQVNTANNEDEYTAFIDRQGLQNITLATVIGNHDSKNRAYSEHFELPNEQAEGATTAGSNYFYTYNNTLFIVLNSNNRSSAEHEETVRKAIAETANKNIKWRVITYHHSVYSVASHAVDEDILQRRPELSEIAKKYNIDLVINGHDHVYVRSHIMDGTIPIEKYNEDGTVPGEYVNPQGTLYLTLNSASGSKYYNIKNQKFPYSAVQEQSYRRNVTKFEVTDDTFTAITYDLESGYVVDKVTLRKTSNTPSSSNIGSINFWDLKPPVDKRNEVEDQAKKIIDENKQKEVPTVKEDKKAEDIDGHWAQKVIEKVLSENLMETKDGKFLPNTDTTRIDVVKALAKMQKIDLKDFKENSFKDVNDADDIAYVNWAVKNGIINGYEDGTFRPLNEITREEIAKILNKYVKAFNIETKKLDAIKFKDADLIADWAKEDIKEATEKALLNGRTDGKFDPKSNLTRAEVAQIISNILEMMK